ncbi:MAG: CidA/LrgA family protein [Paraburkholderia sp.]|uniref:CidA/LrgA family protein n=1 Tax=Paraburkholderia sp. TaxID=1926495 RepID=UPI0011FE91EF|nr:CidA/LrgA family protein [Paraburkholderia sp.]TAM06553.1 MAG: CidA/LrgA family protein [Paraburkholderia sp.]TAM30685.1 MAG: CidA/LrgA family protein [Paraburkholderia sp.]
MTTQRSTTKASRQAGAVARMGLIAVQSALIAGLWFVADGFARATHLPVPGGVVGLVALLALLFCGGVAPRWVKAGADWLLSDMLLFFIPAAVAAVQYGGLFRADGWRLALVVVGGTLMVMVSVAFAVEQAARFERRLALRRVLQARHLTRHAHHARHA